MKRIISCLLYIFAVLALSSNSYALQGDEVKSVHIDEADGTSGQLTNSGAGIKTGHIQDGAVSSAKILDGSVGEVDLATGAVTDVKISGTISASKISSTGLNADTVDGVHASEFATATHSHAQSDVTGLETALNGKADAAHSHTQSDVTGLGAALNAKADTTHDHDGVYQKKYGNVIVVAISGGDFYDPIAAINSINDASSTNPYLIKIMPGVYDLGSGTLYMKEWVDIEGSGENVTVIHSAGNGLRYYSPGTVHGASNAEIRNLTVTNEGLDPDETAAAIIVDNASTRITHVTASAAGGGQTIGIGGSNTSAEIETSPVLNNVTATASGAVLGNNAIYFGRYYDGYWSEWINNNSHPVMNNVTAAASGGASSMGIYLWTGASSSVEMNNVEVTSSGGSVYTYAIYTQSPVVTNNVTATASGENPVGLWLEGRWGSSSSVTVSNSTFTSSGYAAVYTNGGVITIDRSTLQGGSTSIWSGGGADMRIGSSKVVGAVNGTAVCVGSYDGSYAPRGSACE